MSIFISTFTGIIDNKNRITIPSNFKNTLKNAKEKIYAFKSLKNQCIEIYLENKIKSIITSIDEEEFFSKKKDHIKTAILSDLEEVTIDNDGRFVLKEDYKKYLQIKKDIIYIGKGNYFEIWNKSKGIKYKEESRKKFI
jgi:MraZ protein|tara:strand:- start:308 stop:724 length:417 start_codon:yes stop_codon:yes gene_type:complete